MLGDADEGAAEWSRMSATLRLDRSLLNSWRAERTDLRVSEGAGIRLALAVALMVSIFLVDTFTALGSAVAVLYVMVLLLVDIAVGRRIVGMFAAGCAFLTIGSYLWTHGLRWDEQTFFRLVFSLATNLAATVLVLRNQKDRSILEAQARLLDLTNDAIFVRDCRQRIVFWNKGAEALYGWSRQEALGREMSDLFPERSSPCHLAGESSLSRSGRWQGELIEKHRSGRSVHVLSFWRLQKNRNGTPVTILETATDITARRKADEDLRLSEHRFRTIFDTLAVAIWEHDLRPVKVALDEVRASGVEDMRAYIEANPEFVKRARASVRITDVNATALKMLDVPSKDRFFRHLNEFLPESDESFADCMMAIDEGRSTFETETVVRTLHGRDVHVIVALSFPPGGAGLERIQGSFLNITERIRMQQALEKARRERDQAFRVATIGELSASIAHEVNQPLAAIMSYAEAARRWMARCPPDFDEAKTALDDVLSAAKHTGEVVRRVRRLLKNASPEKVELRIEKVMADAVALARTEALSNGVVVQLALQSCDAVIEGDPVLLQQVFLNLMTNAIQAMEAVPAEQRRLTVSTRVTDTGVRVEFVDTGPGFQEADPEDAFVPFHTRKKDGMGLGLAMCRSIVVAHEGAITLHNGPDGGAVVVIELPRSAER